MDETEFSEILRLGLGRAIVHAKLHDVSEFRGVILDACLHCYACDVQSEGTRASYMKDLVHCLPDRDFYHEQILKSLPASGDDWDSAQRFHFAACLAFDGNLEAKRAMYANYNPGPRLGEHIGREFIEMDGIQGLLFVAEKLGALLPNNEGIRGLGQLLTHSLEICGEQSTWASLREAGTHNASIEKYRLAVADAIAPKPFQRVSSLRFQQLFTDLPKHKSYLLSRWGEQASDQELELAAQALIAATNANQQPALLWIFVRRRFPLDFRALMKLVSVEPDRIGWVAVKALTQISHPDVRALAFELMATSARSRGAVIDLLAQNFESGDHNTVLRWFQAEEDREIRHWLGMDLIDFWERHPDEATHASMLCALYERGPCSFCRHSAVDGLIQRHALSDEVRAECAWDANHDIRNLVLESTPPSGIASDSVSNV